jgi:heme exporter protein C
MTRFARLTPLLSTLAFLLLGFSQFLVLMVVPNERVMGAVQRIFYVHVGSAIACYLAFGVVFFAAVMYLATRNSRSDALCVAAGEVGFIFCTIVLITGMIWGHSAWNTWFRWEEPRLVTFLVLWLIFLSFTIVRNFGEPAKSADHGAILGILGALSVPLVWFSIKLLPQTARLHPEVLEQGGLKDYRYWWAFGLSSLAMVCLGAVLTWIRYRLECVERETLTREHLQGNPYGA